MINRLFKTFLFLAFIMPAGVIGQQRAESQEALVAIVAPLMKMSLTDVKNQVPPGSGIFFIGCPNCNGGAQEMGILNWEPGMGDQVKCKFCSMTFPNEKYPHNGEKVIIAPSGAKQVYRYHQNSGGTQYYYEAHAWFERWKWIQQMAVQLSQLWLQTKDSAYGDRAALIAGRFAQLFPDYAIRYDYPSAPKKFFPANQKWPYEGLVPYRGAKWNWWAYGDIPVQIAITYENLQEGAYDWSRMDSHTGKQTDQRIVKDLLISGYEFTAANPEIYTNMSPGMYRDMVRVGRILNRPDIVHDGVNRFREFLKLGFFADGWWKEGTVSYHDQTIGGLESVAKAAKGYSDPADWKGERFENLDLTNAMPFYKSALNVSRQAVFPNGHKLPLNDTWANRAKPEKTDGSAVSRLWPSLGNAALAAGFGKDQTMLNVNWSGNYGHSHYDNASIILFANGAELLSDIGYTHSKYRGWTLHTASHNTVVIDQKVQDQGTLVKPVTGRLMYYDDQNPQVKVVDLDASPAYSTSTEYRRRLIFVHAAEGMDYVIDRFDVAGGETHDWFLHGMCEEEGKLETSISMDRDVKTLVPEWGGTAVPMNQYDSDMTGKKIHAYSYMKDIKAGRASKPWTATWNYKNSGLRTHHIPQKDTEIFSFRAPSVRLAAEDDNKLDNFMRLGIMQRHSANKSSFVAIHEPFQSKPWIKSVRADGDTYLIDYELNGKNIQDKITLQGDKISLISNAGWKYTKGRSQSGLLKGIQNFAGKWNLELDSDYSDVSHVRLDFPDGSSLYFPASHISAKVIQLENDPGFSMDSAGKIRFYTFPHNEYSEAVRYTVFSKSGN
jgi:hypothetical protein